MSHPGAGAASHLLESLDGHGLATLDHLLECRLCRIRLRPVLAERRSEAATLGGRGAGYDRMWERLEAGVLAAVETQARDESLAAPLLTELFALPAAERQNALEEDARFHSWALAGQLLEMGRRAGDADPAIRLDRIHLALILADRLDPSER